MNEKLLVNDFNEFDEDTQTTLFNHIIDDQSNH